MSIILPTIALITIGLITIGLVAAAALSLARVLRKPLPFSPLGLGPLDLFWILILMFLKHLPPPLGFKAPLHPSPNGKGFALPAIRVSAPLVITPGYIHAFNNATLLKKQGKARKSNAPAEAAETVASAAAADAATTQFVSPMFVVAATTPMLLVLLAQPACPIRPIGALNMRNRFEFLRPDLCRSAETLTEKKWLVEASMGGTSEASGGPGVRVKRGVEVRVVIELYLEPSGHGNHGGGSSARKASECVFRQEFCFLQNLPPTQKPLWVDPSASTATTGVDGAGTGAASATGAGAGTATEVMVCKGLALDGDAAKRYAELCKDHKLIYILPWVARFVFFLAGGIMSGNILVAMVLERVSNHILPWLAQYVSEFFGTVICGSYVMALVVERVSRQGQLRTDRAAEDESARDIEARAMDMWWNSEAQVWTELVFHKPIGMPGEFDLKWRDTTRGGDGPPLAFEVSKDGKLYMSGSTSCI